MSNAIATRSALTADTTPASSPQPVAVPSSIRFGREICGDLTAAERREWWLANGRGAYAAGTIAGTLTRRYHGLMVAPVHPPLGRMLVLAKAEATLIDGDLAWPLYTNRWASGSIEPKGHLQIESFRLDGGMPVWTFAFGPIRLEQRIWMEQGADTTYLAFRLLDAGAPPRRPLKLAIRLLANARDHHGQSAAGAWAPEIAAAPSSLEVRDPNFTLTVAAVGGTIRQESHWIEHFELALETERGLPSRDNHLEVGEALLTLEPGRWVGIVGSLEARPATDLGAALARRQAHDRAVLAAATAGFAGYAQAPDWVRQLVLAADSFVFARPLPDAADGQSVIAGYPWFGDWGRDTMIALCGLTLATGRAETARRILETFARFIDRGMLPNVFPGDGSRPDYNTADATLWYIEAWRAYVEATADIAALGRVWPVLNDVIAHHRAGTRYGIGMDPADGLLRAGEPGVQLTWMDAKVGDWVVTPRIGKPVEINALWYNAIRSMGVLANRLGQPGSAFDQLADRIAASFTRFADPVSGGLYDVIDGPAGNDAGIRPNQILAVSLPFTPLSPDRQEGVVGVCGELLLASYGLRSLAPTDPAYQGQYLGDVWRRDGGYHQGPVWAWLLGHYALAEYRVHGNATAAQARLEAIRDHLFDAGLGTISEIFDGAPPHQPRGCPAQAWSVATVLEAWWRLAQRRQAVA